MMTFQELEASLPNGFHDSKLLGLDIDWIGRSIVITVDLLAGLPDAEDPEAMRVGRICVREACLFFIEPPDPEYHFSIAGGPSGLDGDGPWRLDQTAELDSLIQKLPAGTTTYRFYLADWNSYLYLAGSNVEFSWTEEADKGLPRPNRQD